MTQIEIINALSDNYIYVLHNPVSQQTAVIDPGEAQPVIELLKKKNWHLSHIFNTHHHHDHIGGNEKLINKYNCKIIAPKYENDKISNIDMEVKDGDTIFMTILKKLEKFMMKNFVECGISIFHVHRHLLKIQL